MHQNVNTVTYFDDTAHCKRSLPQAPCIRNLNLMHPLQREEEGLGEGGGEQRQTSLEICERREGNAPFSFLRIVLLSPLRLRWNFSRMIMSNPAVMHPEFPPFTSACLVYKIMALLEHISSNRSCLMGGIFIFHRYCHFQNGEILYPVMILQWE